jgi:methylglyoxal synthase
MKTIACIAHDGKKPEMVRLVHKYAYILKDFNLIATGTTGIHIEQVGDLTVTKLKSGPLGGDAQIASLVVEGKIDLVIFLVDPLDVHPHQVDVSMLVRICNVHDIPLATNIATAELLLKAL